MTRTPIAYMPLLTYPETVPDDSIRAAAGFAASLGWGLGVTAFAVTLPRVTTGLGDLLLDIPSLVHAAEEKSRAECQRLDDLVRGAVLAGGGVTCETRRIAFGAVLDDAAAQARTFDLSLMPWSSDAVAANELAEAVVFGSGRPAILIPPGSRAAAIDHLAIAWDGSRVAARALGDALALLGEGGRVTVLTVQDEKPLSGPDLAATLSRALTRRGIAAEPIETALGGRAIGEALQDAALASGATLLAMGGFGHSRFRDFVLGGATKGILERLRMPVLLSH